MLASALRRTTCTVVVLGRSPAPALLAAPSLVRSYHENVVDPYESPRNVGTWLQGAAHVRLVFQPLLCSRFPHARHSRPPPLQPCFSAAPARLPGSLPKDDPNVGTGFVGAPACGDVMKMQVRLAWFLRPWFPCSIAVCSLA